ncbi:hypothetical protein V6N11_052257 [Hibiscus sabdariffa]|uniref:Uncharacterized protein n=1 Tax=Hibiscus sabdariffa TaxID=183260 RepID=A0ABR2U9S0_9ROSI
MHFTSLPAIVEYTGTYIYEGSGFKAIVAQQYGSSLFLSGLKSLYSKSFHRVCSHIIRTVIGFQLCYAEKTWHGGFLGMMIFGASEMSRNVDFAYYIGGYGVANMQSDRGETDSEGPNEVLEASGR